MRTTLEFPADVLQQCTAVAVREGVSLNEVVASALRAHPDRQEKRISKVAGWRQVFGQAPPGATAEIDAIVESAFEQINPDDWR